jgi:large subunit ribosomal protein L30e
MIDLDKAIATAVKTGKVSFGTKVALQCAKTAKAKMILLASNCPKNIRENIEYYGKVSRVPTMMYKGTSLDLANVCNKLFVISALSIRETGDSEILKAVESDEGQDSSGGIK